MSAQNHRRTEMPVAIGKHAHDVSNISQTKWQKKRAVDRRLIRFEALNAEPPEASGSDESATHPKG